MSWKEPAKKRLATEIAIACYEVLVDLCALAMLTKQTIESSGGPKASGKLVSCIEYFAGKARVAKAFKKTRRASRAFDYMSAWSPIGSTYTKVLWQLRLPINMLKKHVEPLPFQFPVPILTAGR